MSVTKSTYLTLNNSSASERFLLFKKQKRYKMYMALYQEIDKHLNVNVEK